MSKGQTPYQRLLRHLHGFKFRACDSVLHNMHTILPYTGVDASVADLKEGSGEPKCIQSKGSRIPNCRQESGA